LKKFKNLILVAKIVICRRCKKDRKLVRENLCLSCANCFDEFLSMKNNYDERFEKRFGYLPDDDFEKYLDKAHKLLKNTIKKKLKQVPPFEDSELK
jgi:hypothetical protein